MRLVVISLAMLLAWPVAGQKSKKSVEILPVETSGGITYSLPRTGIRVKVTATRTDFVAGPYALYAESLLGIQKAGLQSRVTWNIDDIELGTFAEPDPDQRYQSGNLSAALLQLTPDGCLAAINAPEQPTLGQELVSNTFVLPAPKEIPAFTRLTNNAELTGRAPLEQRATAAAVAILKARQSRLDIVTGMLDEFHPDGEAYEQSLEELRHIEKSNLKLFTGITEHTTYTFYYDFIPAAAGAKGEVIFRFDESLGFLPKTDFSGKPVMIDVEPVSTVAPGPATSLSAPAAGNTSGGNTAVSPSGSNLYCRQPAPAEVRITRELTPIATGRLPIAQLGAVTPVPEGLLNGNYAILFWPETGAIKSVTKNQ